MHWTNIIGSDYQVMDQNYDYSCIVINFLRPIAIRYINEAIVITIIIMLLI